MKRITINPQTDHRWQALIDSQPSSVFHTPAWIRVLAETYGFDIKAEILVDSDNTDDPNTIPAGGLPYCHIADIRGHRISSLPFCDYTDPLAHSFEHWEQLVEPLVEESMPYKIRPLHNLAPVEDSRFEKTNQARWHGLDISPSLDELWRGIHGSVRTSIRKARKHNLIIRNATSEYDLGAFFQLHANVRKNKYRMVAQPYQFFRNIWENLIMTNNGQLIVAEYNNEIVAATIFLHWRGILYYKFNASNPRMLWLNPNEPLLWAGIQYGKEIGCHQLDFGLSDWGQDGLIFFKKKFADMEKPISFMQTRLPASVTSAEDTGQHNEVGALLPQLTELFTHESVPMKVTQDAGALLYRYFA